MSTKIRRRNLNQLYLGLTGFAAIAAAVSASASPTETPEQETLRISKVLRPISDDSWRQVAGEKVESNYDISRGDTLYDISKRLFGDARYWPKVWALNNASVLNPHMIHPGNHIVFMPGTGTTLPAVSVETASAEQSNATMTDASPVLPPLPKPVKRSREWQSLPQQQWEAATIEAEQAAKIEVVAMSELDKVHAKMPTRELPLWVASQPMTYLGEIVAAPTMTTYLKVGDQVLIQASNDEIKHDESYALTHAPYDLEPNEKKRRGYSFRVDGEVRIIGTEGRLLIGVITHCRAFITRGTKLVPALPRLKVMEPIPAPAVQEGIFYVDKGDSTSISGQYHFGFVNLGSEDGLQEGMILENYQPKDLNTGKSFSRSDLFHVADMQVVQVSERFSTVRIVSGTMEVYDGMPVRLLTDVARLGKYGALPVEHGDTAPPVPAEQPPEPENPPPPVVEPPSPDMSHELKDAQSLDEKATDAAAVVPPPAPPAPKPTNPPAPPAQEAQTPPPPPPAPEPAPTPTQAPTQAPEQTKASNELDALDGEDHLAPHEERELQQLENYKAKDPIENTTPAPAGVQSAPPPPPAPETAPATAPATVEPAGGTLPPAGVQNL